MPLYFIKEDGSQPDEPHRHLIVTQIQDWGARGPGEIVNTNSPQGRIRLEELRQAKRRCETCRVQLDTVVIPK